VTLYIIIAALSVILIISLVLSFKLFRGKHETVVPDVIPTVIGQAMPSQKGPAQKAMKITLNGKEYRFFLNPKNEHDARKTLSMIKNSLILMQEGKYKDIVDSRLKAVEENLVRLQRATSLQTHEIKDMVAQARAQAQACKAALG